MRRFLLDTHVFLWWIGGSDRLSQPVQALLANPANEVFVSAVSTWEIAIKKALGKLKAPGGLAEVIRQEGFAELPVSVMHTQGIEDLPPIHQDPFDRLLIAQAKVEGLEFVSSDQYAAAYGIPVLVL